MAISEEQLEELAQEKVNLFKKFLAAEPPKENGESLLDMWAQIYDDEVKNTVVETVKGPSDPKTNPVFPYEKLYAIIGDGGNWKWPRMWQKLDELERRGTAYREGEKLNFQQPNKNPNIVPQRVLVVGGGPVGLRMAMELVLGGHKVTLFEKRREKASADGELEVLGFTNRINRPHMWPFVRNDLARLNGRDFMTSAAAFPVFTEPDTSSIGIDELQILLMKSALMLGVDFRLGVGFDDAKVVTDPKSMKPTWNVECTVDEEAAAFDRKCEELFGLQAGKCTVNFDVLIGCDGPRSQVRETQQRHFGDITRRKFMDCVGIVANIRKVPNKRLRELGFEHGQAPKDMNRTTMVFKDFFNKIKDEADADLENFIYYKASHHYYIILTPKRANLIKHGLSGKVYTFHAARSAGTGDERAQEKAKLRAYVNKVLKAAGIPVDEKQANDGFVDAPNDVMAFDFAECWHTKKSMSYNMPPADYNVEEHGPWMGKKLLPLVALAGDSLLEPFWPQGLGLQRGWQAIMDTCYAVDNLYNRQMFATQLQKAPDEVTWDEHYQALTDQIDQNYEYCNRLTVCEEFGKGEYADNSLVIQQLNKKLRDAEKPLYEVEIDPATRYAPLAMTRDKEYRQKSLDGEFLHPLVSKVIARKDFYDKYAKAGGAKGEIEYHGKALISVNGKKIASAADGGYQHKPPPRKSVIIEPGSLPAASAKTAIPLAEVEQKSEAKRHSLAQACFAGNLDQLLQRQGSFRRESKPPTGAGALGDESTMHEIGHVPPSHVSESVTESTEAMWDRMHEKHLSVAQKAELAHIRFQITALTKSLDAYKQAEKELLMGS